MVNSIQSPFTSEEAIQIPFTVPKSGSVATTTSQEKVWEYRVKMALGTSVGERLLRMQYGVDITDLAFNTSSIAEQIVEREIQTVFARYLPDLSIDEVTADFDYPNGVLNVSVSYYLPDSTLSNTTVGVATISDSAPISEV